ncbi:MAG TPA: hypothetical protein VFW63_07275 [Acidimicrobiales bacterium]|nr:hypothetical protein [Acidimicrobiales bacterium]
MTTRRDLRALTDAAPAGLRTLRGALTTWVHRSRAAQVLAGAPLGEGADPVPLGALPSVAGEAGEDDGPEVARSWYVVVAPPDRWRVVGRGAVSVSDGRHSWVGTSTLVTEHDAAGALLHDAGAIAACLYPGAMLRGLVVGDPVADAVDGRTAWLVEAAPLPAGAGGTAAPPPHPDLLGVEHRLWLDVATGIVLRHEGSVEGAPCSTLELTDVVVDADLDPGDLRPPPGAVVRSRHELLRDHLAAIGVDPDTVDLDDPAQVRAALRGG